MSYAVFSLDDAKRIRDAVKTVESGGGNLIYRRKKHSAGGGGNGGYNGMFKVIDVSDDPTTPPYKVQIIWGEFPPPDNEDVAGICQVNGSFRVVEPLISNSTFTTSGYVFLQWEWDVSLQLPTLEHEELYITDPITYTANYLKWSLAWIDVTSGISITQIWLGGSFQASLFGEC